MMGRTFFAAAALALGVMAASTADAQSSSASGVQFGVSGGLAMPMGDFGDIANTGFGIGGHLGFNPASVPFGLRADLAYFRFGLDDDFADGNASIIGGALNAILKVPMEAASIAPYLLAGPGIYNGKLDIDGCGDACDGETKVALQGGAGLMFNLSGMATNLEIKYITVFTEDENTNFFPITFGIMFGGAR